MSIFTPMARLDPEIALRQIDAAVAASAGGGGGFKLLGSVLGVDFNALGDNPIDINSALYAPVLIVFANRSGDPTNFVNLSNLRTASDGAGNRLNLEGGLSVAGIGAAQAVELYWLGTNPQTPNPLLQHGPLTGSTLYLHVTNVEGEALTADVHIFGLTFS